jgi:hypothetical protein
MPILFATAAMSVLIALVSPLIFFVIGALRNEEPEAR